MKHTILCCILLGIALSITGCTISPAEPSEEVSDRPASTAAPSEVSSAEVSSADVSSADVSSAASEVTSVDPVSSSTITPVIPENLPVYVDGSIRLVGGDTPFGVTVFTADRKYRRVYYILPEDFHYNLATYRGYYDVPGGYEAFLKDFQAFEAAYPKYNFEADEMVLVSAIKWFNITREEMEYILTDDIEFRQSSLLDGWHDSEVCELPNLDILYTLDNDVINEYYRYA